MVNIAYVLNEVDSSYLMENQTVGLRIQPLEIEVPEKDPFKNDLLERKEPTEVLTHLIGSIDGPCVLAVDSIWGAGKTTFIRIWAQFLRNKGFVVIEFNAWSTDYSKDPFLALSSEINEGIRKCDGDTNTTQIDKMVDATVDVIRWVAPIAVRFGMPELVDFDPNTEKEVAQGSATFIKERLAAYGKGKETVTEFKQALSDTATAVTESHDFRPLVVLIDELDRCRPSYAVELLEIAKHLFTVDHIVFVLAINRSELSHSIKALYGSSFDAEGYLRRFFDVNFRLPEPDRQRYVSSLFNRIGIEQYFKRTQDPSASEDFVIVQDLLQSFFSTPVLDFRSIAQAIHHLGLVFGSLRDDRFSFAISTTVALILRTIDLDLYYRFIRGEVSDSEVVDAVYNRPGTKDLRSAEYRHVFDAVIVTGALEISDASFDKSIFESPLLSRYKSANDSERSDEESAPSQEFRYRESVIKLVEHYREQSLFRDRGIGFMHSVQRIELLSQSLVDDSVTDDSN